MKCFEIPLCPLLKVTRMNKQKLNSKIRHCTRVINEYILYIVKSGIVYDNVKRIVEYIEEQYKENFDSKCIERDLLINFDYANRIFRKHFGYSIIKYRNRLRINTARVLHGEKSMREIATEVGFSDVYYFSRCFKKYEGVSPSEYKRYTLGLKKADDLVED